jgi:hypothetical protein
LDCPPRSPTTTRATPAPKLADHDNCIDCFGRLNPKIRDATVFIECSEGTKNNPGPAVPGAKAWRAELVPEKCLGYPDYKYGRGRSMFNKGKKKRPTSTRPARGDDLLKIYRRRLSALRFVYAIDATLSP